jgi:hypothetical protein
MNQNDPDGELNVRSERYILAHTRCRCGSCRAETDIVALALPPGHESLTLDFQADGDTSAGHAGASAECNGDGPAGYAGDESGEYVWESAASAVFLFYVESLPASVHGRLSAISRGYRRAVGESAAYYANHCEACGRMFDDQELFCEPEGAFLPTNAADAAAIRLTAIDEPIGARAAGYAVAPQSFEFMSAGG